LALTILVNAPEKTRIERVTKRDNSTVEDVEQRMNNQRKQTDNIPLADFIINNDGERNLIQQVLSIHKLILLENHTRKVLS
jgi:dephospho-CoA kinase